MDSKIDVKWLSQHPFYGLIHNSNLIEGFDSPEMDLTSLKCLEALSDLDLEIGLSHLIIRRIQQDIVASQTDLFDQYRGNYRSQIGVECQVGGVRAPHSFEVQSLMDQWLENFNARTPRQNHIEFERIHPFADGNGRTGRLLMWWQELKLEQEPTLIRFDERYEYYNWFK